MPRNYGAILAQFCAIIPTRPHPPQVSELLAQKANSFEHNTIYRVSVAAAPLAAWVKANLEYAVVLKKVGPMMQENAALEAELNSSKERLAQCQRELSGLDAKVAELKADFQKRTAEAETLKVSLAKAEAVLGSAQTLLEKLSGERGRWEEMAAEYNEEMRSIAGAQFLRSSARNSAQFSDGRSPLL